MKHIALCTALAYLLHCTWAPWTLAQSTGLGHRSSDSLLLNKEDISFRSGSVYYTSRKKDEVLVKTNVWGAVQFPGVHYVPLGTRFLEALSLAGGPLDKALTDEIILSSKNPSSDALNVTEISVQKALTNDAFNPVLQADDIVIVKEDRSSERITLWLSIGTFLISVAALSLLVADRK